MTPVEVGGWKSGDVVKNVYIDVDPVEGSFKRAREAELRGALEDERRQALRTLEMMPKLDEDATVSEMKYADRVRAAKSAQEAMLILAEGIDAVLAVGADMNGDGWGTWGGDLQRDESDSSVAASDAPMTAKDFPSEDYYAARKAEVDQEHLARLEAHIERLTAMYAKSPTLSIAQMLEQAQSAYHKVSEPGEYLDHSGDIPGEPEIAKYSEGEDGQVVVDLPVASIARKMDRRSLAEEIDLPGFFGPLYNNNPQLREQIFDAYEKGGPMWLYANRITPDEHDIFDQLPVAAKTAMVADVAEDSTRAAWEFQRDIMRSEDEQGATLDIARDNLNGVVDGPRVALRGSD